MTDINEAHLRAMLARGRAERAREECLKATLLTAFFIAVVAVSCLFAWCVWGMPRNSRCSSVHGAERL